MKTIVEKFATIIFTVACLALVYVGFTMMLEVGVGYLWLAMYTIGAYGLAYQVFDYFVSEATN